MAIDSVIDTFAVSHISVCEPRVIRRYRNPTESCVRAAVSMTASGSAMLASGAFRTQDQIEADLSALAAYVPA